MNCLAKDAPQFNRDVRPILSENCFHCHGQDPAHREAGLRLDTKEALHGKTEDGAIVVAPGNPEDSLLWQRIISNDPDMVMPPPDSHRSLSEAQIETLRQWIDSGAPFEEHWAFIPPQKTKLPEIDQPVHQPWDKLVLNKLAEKSLTPSPEASPAIWLRRASFDLTGLAPSPEEVAVFEKAVSEKGETAYEEAADKLLASPRYGEHMAGAWLDLARYADTHGFNNDTTRNMWRWRDWVIEAFNENMPYDHFVIDQLAGDLLPEADLDSRLATGFNRNHVINSEGGIIDEEYRAEYVADRVRTVGTAWLGLTMECARCHDHKYDNISQKDYYELYAFFNQVPEQGEAARLRNAAPLMRAPTKEQQHQLAALEKQLAKAEAEIPKIESKREFQTPKFDYDDKRKVILEQKEFPLAGDERLSTEWIPTAGNPFTFSSWVRWEGGEGVIFSSINYGGEPSAQGYASGVELRVLDDGRLEFRASSRWPGYANQIRSIGSLEPGKWHAVTLRNEGDQHPKARRLFIDFEEQEMELLAEGVTNGARSGKAKLGTTQGGEPDSFNGQLAKVTTWPDALSDEKIDQFLESTLSPGAPWSTQREDITSQRAALSADDDYREAWHKAREIRREKLALIRTFPSTMIMADLPEPRQTHILNRGVYDNLGEEVEPNVMEKLLLSWPEGEPKNRLGLAKWLTHPDHPLTSRVVVNRFWQQVFGIGLVKTADDFGVQGEYPSNPELIDWLSRDFIDSGWDVKRLFKSFVLSSTYRQASGITKENLEQDPENRLLARGPRFRLPAESVRDHALRSAGMLVEKVGGPSVYPFQPEGYYKGMVVGADYPSTTWTDSTGDNLFRRSLYTFWKRTVPHPVSTVFDKPDREVCVATRSRTNTPLQALTLMNEKGMLYAAAGLGQRIHKHSPDNPEAAVKYGFEITTGREPNEEELNVLLKAFDQSMADWQQDIESAKSFLAECGVENPENPAVDATHAMVAHLLLNLDETITKH